MDLGFAVLLTFFVLFVLGFPVVFAILIPSIAYIAWEGIPLATVAQRVLYALDSFPLVAVPVFIFVGNLMNAAGITEKIYHFANTLAGRLPGGLAQVNIVGSLIFSGVSGAALADVGGIGRIEIKAMKDEGFPGAVRGRADRRLGDRRADLPAVDPGHHLCGRHVDLGDPAAGRRHHPGAASASRC